MEKERVSKTISDEIRSDFTHITKISKNGELIDFSVDIILRDLNDTGMDVLKALDVLYAIKPYMEDKMPSYKIVQLIIQVLPELGYDKESYVGSLLQPIMIEYKNKESNPLNFRILRNIVRSKLQRFNYSKKSFQMVVNELHRVIVTLRTDIIKQETIDRMIPSVLRNIIGVNPFSDKKYEEDYHTLSKLIDSLSNTWEFLPEDEQIGLTINLFDSLYRLILLSFDHLPGHTVQSTIGQINQLIAEFTEKNVDFIPDKEIYLLGKSSKKILSLINNPNDNELLNQYEWIDISTDLRGLVENLLEKGQISWLVVTDQSGNEIYARFDEAKSPKHRTLIGMAISGVQSLVNELTDKEIKQIDQDEGSILIERRKNFSLITHSKSAPTPYIKKTVSEMAYFIANDLREEIDSFNGNVNELYERLDDYVDSNLSSLFPNNTES